MPEIRKLRTILFADIVGYTALMQGDEASGSAPTPPCHFHRKKGQATRFLSWRA